jgi:diguanylate cyclase (GGDEF)-like protein
VTEQNKANKLQAAILRISQAAMTANLISELFEIIHETLQTLMPARNMYIALYDAKTEIISFPYFADEMDEPPPSRKFGHGWTEIVINTGKPVLIHEDLLDGMESPDRQVQGTRPVGWLGAPLFVQDKIIGVLVIQSYDPATIYSNEDKDLLMIAANQVAMAIYKKKTEERLIFSTSHDELTGLYNRAYFEDEVKRLSELPDEPIGVIMMDLDNLKYTNDTYGHAAGDQLIRTTATITRSAFRMKDMIARIGGDEIVVLIPGASRDILQTAIDRVRSNLAQYNRVLTDKDAMISLSLGGSITSAEVTLEQAIQAADEAMYREKADKKANGTEYMRQ